MKPSPSDCDTNSFDEVLLCGRLPFEGKTEEILAKALWSSLSQVVLVAQLVLLYAHLWALWVILTARKVKRGEFQFDPADWKHVSGSENEMSTATTSALWLALVCRSDDAKSLILWLLKTNPHERYTAKHWPQVSEKESKDGWISRLVIILIRSTFVLLNEDDLLVLACLLACFVTFLLSYILSNFPTSLVTYLLAEVYAAYLVTC